MGLGVCKIHSFNASVRNCPACRLPSIHAVSQSNRFNDPGTSGLHTGAPG